jgi:hypothetical protein
VRAPLDELAEAVRQVRSLDGRCPSIAFLIISCQVTQRVPSSCSDISAVIHDGLHIPRQRAKPGRPRKITPEIPHWVETLSCLDATLMNVQIQQKVLERWPCTQITEAVIWWIDLKCTLNPLSIPLEPFRRLGVEFMDYSQLKACYPFKML